MLPCIEQDLGLFRKANNVAGSKLFGDRNGDCNSSNEIYSLKTGHAPLHHTAGDQDYYTEHTNQYNTVNILAS